MPGMPESDMMRWMVLAVALCLGACAPDEAPQPRTETAVAVKVEVEPTAASATTPVVVELYQSQGCSSCPPANDNLNRVAGDVRILALSFAVTYWDQLGWKDRFGKPEFTQRQWDYANAADRGRVYTPQVIVNGEEMMLGANQDHFARLIASAPPAGGPAIERRGDTVRIAPGIARGTADIWLVRYDPRERNVAIGRGENGGRTLPHRNIVTELRDLGDWSGHELRLTVPAAADPALSAAILVQQHKGGPIIAARRW